MTILVATTCAPWKCDGRQELAWLDCAEQLREFSPAPVEFFAALEIDGRGDLPYAALSARLVDGLDGHVWRFAMDDGSTVVDGTNRLIRICAGRNLGCEFAQQRADITHVLWMDSDITPPQDAIARLLEVRHPIVGGHVGTYCLDGPPVTVRKIGHAVEGSPEPVEQWVAEDGHGMTLCGDERPFPIGADVRAHWNTAGFLMWSRDVFRRVRWRWDLEIGSTDDPCTQADARELFGETWVRHDVIGEHVPIPMVPIEHRGADLTRVPW